MERKTFDRILLAVDHSAQSQEAASAVSGMALAMGAEVVVVHVWTGNIPAHGNFQLKLPPQAQRLVADVVENMGRDGVRATWDLRRSPPSEVAEEIVSAAEAHQASLIALGSRGLSDVRGLFLGSVSHRVIEDSDRPVLVVRGGHAPAGPVKHVLLAGAGGEDVPGSVEAAVAIARAAEAEVEVVVLHARYLLPTSGGLPFIDTDEDSQETVRATLEALKRAGVRATPHTPLSANVTRQIVDEAVASNADVIVMGSRRLSDLESLFLGGVSHDVMRLSDRPVLLARQARATCPW
jgi:nucleotide-binding universal stress UspA family protein